MKQTTLKSKTGTKFIYIVNGNVHSARAKTKNDTRMGQYASATKDLYTRIGS